MDLKAFTEEFYREHCKARLGPVLDTLRHIAQNTDIWLEVTTLIVPSLNDSDEEIKQIAEFIANDLGVQVPWHISRFHPDYQQDNLAPTTSDTLEAAYEIGKQAGLHYIYIGNLPGCGKENTVCQECGHLLIERMGYQLGQYNIVNGSCPGCGTKAAGVGLDPVRL